MRILVAALLLAGLAAAAQASTTPGTILTTSATASYADSGGQAMPQETSNPANVLVVSANPGRTVAMAVRSIFAGPSTVGMTIKIAGNVFTDANGVTWIGDGSVSLHRDATGKRIATKLYCKVSTLFLTQRPAPARYVVTGISQVEADGTRVIIPSQSMDVQSL